MNSFNTILLQPKTVVKQIIEQIPLNDIAMALKFEEQDIRDYFIENMTNEQKQILQALFSDIDEATPEDSNKAKIYINKILKEIVINN
ncbi:MAG: FliG C-terminal domain-containing protein [Candidatus Cloacimonetes bacterium]|nr:hypothetical protein [Candidatus Cloacimonadota bacterium]MDD4156444.1 FliG C-terminal domain-containing protein [Candidatus Cloacimonadota bacterium]